jgi:zinc transport system permease protein
MDSLIITLIITVVLASLMTAPLGCVGLWNGLAFFGDTLAHASLLGVCISMLTHTPYAFGGIIVAIFLAVAVAKNNDSPKDVTLAAISYTCLAVSLIIISKYFKGVLDPNTVLFGDILSVQIDYLWFMAVITLVILALLFVFFKPIQMVSFDVCLAHTKKIPVMQVRFLLLISYGVAIGTGLKVLGALFVPAIALLPAAAARNISQSPLQMIIFATIISTVCGVLGLFLSIMFDLPTGPAIVAMNALALILAKFSKN